MSQHSGSKGKSILLLLCIVLVVVSVASVGLVAYQNFHPIITTTQIATSFLTETSVSVSVSTQTSVSYTTVTTAMGTTTVPYAYAPCYGGNCVPYVEQFSNFCYNANSIGAQCTLYGFLLTSSNGCLLLSVFSSYNGNIYYDLKNWLPSYPATGYVTVNGYIDGPSSSCSAIAFHVTSINQ